MHKYLTILQMLDNQLFPQILVNIILVSRVSFHHGVADVALPLMRIPDCLSNHFQPHSLPSFNISRTTLRTTIMNTILIHSHPFHHQHDHMFINISIFTTGTNAMGTWPREGDQIFNENVKCSSTLYCFDPQCRTLKSLMLHILNIMIFESYSGIRSSS